MLRLANSPKSGTQRIQLTQAEVVSDVDQDTRPVWAALASLDVGDVLPGEEALAIEGRVVDLLRAAPRNANAVIAWHPQMLTLTLKVNGQMHLLWEA